MVCSRRLHAADSPWYFFLSQFFALFVASSGVLRLVFPEGLVRFNEVFGDLALYGRSEPSRSNAARREIFLRGPFKPSLFKHKLPGDCSSIASKVLVLPPWLPFPCSDWGEARAPVLSSEAASFLARLLGGTFVLNSEFFPWRS